MAAAKPEITQGKKLTAIWIAPLVAVVLGIWMVVFTFMTEGPEIEIAFKTAVGLEAGKTKVKFRNVEMGMVQEVTLSDDMKGVIAVVKLEREAIPLLGEDTRFWVVRAHVGGGGISGLDTLLSGAYIEISPASSQSKVREFVALEQPPLTPIGAPGLRLILLSEHSASVSSGDPVLYNGFNVGRVESVTFDPESQQIRYVIFIDAPYHSLVNSSVRFWDVSGVTLSAGAEGLKFSTSSLETILLGGVTFGTAPGLGPGQPVEHNTEFRLFPSYDAILDSPFEQRTYYVVAFEQSLKGLLPGAPVEYRGIQVGKVERILVKELFEVDQREGYESKGHPIPVLIYMEPGLVALPDKPESIDDLRMIIKQSVNNGLRVSLHTANLLTGAQVVNIEFYDDVAVAELGEFAGYTTIPTIASGLGLLEHRISTLLDKVNSLPLGETVGSVNLAVMELNRTLAALRTILEDENTRSIPIEVKSTLAALQAILEDDSARALPADLQRTLGSLRDILEKDSTLAVPDELQQTLAAARFQLQGESNETYQLVTTLKEVESAARSLREFLDLMEVKPESLIRGKRNTGN
jgi:paraquat-inducible protein B